MNLRVVKFLFEEAFISLRQNVLMATIAIMTISISLIILAVFLLLFFDINSAIGGVSRNLTIVTYLDKEITSSGISKVEEQFALITGIKNVEFVSKEDAWKKMKDKFKYQEDIVNLVQGNPLPDSFVLTLESPDKIEDVAKELKLVEGVSDVRFGKEVVSKLRMFVQVFNYVGLSVVGFLLLATLLIIINTINLTILAKKFEVEIMKLVGATNNFVKWCFRIEGLVMGFLGAIVAIVIVDGIFSFVTYKIHMVFPFISVFTQGLSIITLNIFLLCLGLIIGLIGSSISIKSLLKSILKK